MSAAVSQIEEAKISPWLVLATVMFGTLLIGLDRTVVSLGLPKVIAEFGSTVAIASWVATAYIISNAIFVPVFGKLGDMFGNKIIYLTSFIAFIVFSLLAGVAWNMPSLIAFRALQGLVGAAVYPTALSLIAKTFLDPKERVQAMGIWSASFAASSVFGPLIGGPLIDAFSWRMLFYINLPIGLIGIIMTLLFLTDDRPEEKRKGFDFVGAILLGVSLSSLVIVLDRGSDWGWNAAGSFICYTLFVVFGLWFYFKEKVTVNPLVDFKFFQDRTFSLVLIISFISFGGMMGAMFLIPLFAQLFLGYNATQTGFLFLPMALSMFVMGPLGGKFTNKFGARKTISAGMMVSAFGIYLLSHLDARTTASELTYPMMIFAAGLGTSMAPLTNLATANVPTNEIGVASAIINLVRNLAGAVGITIFSSLLTRTIEKNIFDVSASTIINTPFPDVEKLLPLLIVLKSEILAYGNVFGYASLAMFLGGVAAFFYIEDIPHQDRDLAHAHSAHVEI